MSKKILGITENDVLIYGKYLQVAIFLQHSNRIQLRYKLLASTWFLATFIGVGYSLSTVEVGLPFHPLLVAPLVCVASLCVMGIMWYLDIIVQEKNIATAVHQGLDLEEKYSWLPNSYHNVVKLHFLAGYVFMKSVFYLSCATILLLTICFCVTSYLYLESNRYWFVPIYSAALTILFLFWISIRVTEMSDPYRSLRKLRRK